MSREAIAYRSFKPLDPKAQRRIQPVGSSLGRERHQRRVANLDILRGVAALLVCIFHFDRNGFSGIGLFSSAAKYGFVGVDIFFVVSGFIIPFALERSQFNLQSTGSFLLSRLLRLYPAYLIAILINIALWQLSSLLPGFRGSNPSLNVSQIIGNLLLICDFQKQSWISPVFWSLAIEAQYYVLMAISYPALNHQSKTTRYAALAFWICAPWIIRASPFVFSWTALFAMGTLCFLRRGQRVSGPLFVIFMVLAFSVHGFAHGWLGASVGVLTSFFILFFPEVNSRILIWTGMVSYSLYLLHVPIGGRIVNFAERLPNTPAIRLAALLIALAFSLLVATLFFRFVEEPSHQLSRQIRRQSGGSAAG